MLPTVLFTPDVACSGYHELRSRDGFSSTGFNANSVAISTARELGASLAVDSGRSQGIFAVTSFLRGLP